MRQEILAIIIVMAIISLIFSIRSFIKQANIENAFRGVNGLKSKTHSQHLGDMVTGKTFTMLVAKRVEVYGVGYDVATRQVVKLLREAEGA